MPRSRKREHGIQNLENIVFLGVQLPDTAGLPCSADPLRRIERVKLGWTKHRAEKTVDVGYRHDNLALG
ncbi:MAG: hypothetical protein V3V75_01475 [Thermoguttaceae bacterium]